MPFKLIDKWTPDFIQNKIGILLDEIGQYIQTGGRYLSSVSSISNYYSQLDVHTLEHIQELEISTMDSAAEKIANNRKRLATVQGASTCVLSLEIK